MRIPWKQHRPQIVSGIAGLAVGALVVGAVWGLVSLDHAAAPVPGGSTAPLARESTRSTPSGSATPEVGLLDDDGGRHDAESDPDPSSGSRSGPGVTTAGTPADCGRATTTVRSTSQLESALSGARPGDVIALADGTYTGEFVGKAVGTASAPIALCGGSGAVLDGGDVSKGYVMHLDGAAYWTLSGFTVKNGQKGVMLDDTQHSVVDHLTVRDIGDEGIHVRAGSSDNTVQGNAVSRTGMRKPQFGEGIYVGSSKSNWCRVSDCKPDESNRNVVTANHVADTAAENVDIKEGTTGGVLSHNSFDGTGMQGENHADSWVDVKGNDWEVTDNTGVHSPLDGFQTHELLDGWGTDNTFSGNTVDLGNSDGVAFAFRPVLGNTVSCHNDVIGSNEFSTTKCTG